MRLLLHEISAIKVSQFHYVPDGFPSRWRYRKRILRLLLPSIVGIILSSQDKKVNHPFSVIILKVTQLFCLTQKRHPVDAVSHSFEIQILRSCTILGFHNIFTVIVIAVRANSVRKLWLVALRTNRKSRCFHLHVRRSSLISSCFWSFSLRYCHVLHLLAPMCDNSITRNHKYLWFYLQLLKYTVPW